MVQSLIIAGANWLVEAGIASSLAAATTYATFAVSFALSQIVSRVFADNPSSQQDMGVRQQVPPSQVNAIPIVYGDAYMGGTFIDAVLSTDQKTMYYVLAISSISSANSTLGTSAGVFNYDCSNMYYGDRLISFSSSGSVQSVRVFNGGTGYVVGDVLTVVGGTSTTTTVLTVASVNTGGVVVTANVTIAGSYTVAPNNPALVTGGTGTGASFVLKFSTYTNTVTALSDESGNVDTKVNGNLYINLYKSTSAGVITSANGAAAPSTVMGGSDIATAQQWTSGNRQMYNLGFAIVKLNYNRDADTTALNPITFHVSHYPNGASVAKPGDVWLDYMTNQDYGGAVGWLPDGTFSASFIDTTAVTTLNTYSDETITYTPVGGSSTVTQPRYRINGVLDAGQTVLNNIDSIMSACDSWLTYNAALGQWSVIVNKAESASYSFNDNNIIGEIRVSATDITSSINQVEARFPFKENRDQASFVNLETPSSLMYPNEPTNKYSITYDMVNDSVQAQYLANRLLEQAREDLIVSFSTTYYGIQVDAGQVVSVTNADYGWTNKLFRVMKVNEASLPDGSLGAKLELNEYNAQVYDNVSIQQFTPAPNSGLPSVSYFSPLAAPTVTGYPTATIPYINVQVYVPATGRVTFGNLFWTTSATPTAADWKLVANASSANGQPVVNNSYYTFSNITLNTGTYYFAYMVGNDVTSSTLSPISAALVWNPVAAAGPFVDISGFTGFSKNSAGTVITPASSVLTAVVQNVTSPTYSWAITGATPTTGSASTITITPSLSASSVTAALTVNGSNLSAPIVRTITMPITLDGSGGAAGLNSATVYLYNKNTSTTPPALFSGTFTYTFTSGVLSGGTLNGWSQTPPSIAAGEFLFLSLATASSTAATDTIPYTEFSTPQVISGTGTNGANTAIVSLFNSNSSAVSAPTLPTGTFTYTFATAVLSGGTLNSWSQTAPSLTTGQYLWQIQATAYSSAATDTIAASEFSGAVVVGANGAAGNSFRIAYYTQSQSLSAPSVSPNPTSGSTSFPTSVAWSGSITSPAAGQSLWAIDGTYVATTNQTTWSAPYLTQGFPTTIQSDNYVVNTSGWQIQRDTGNAYFNNGFFRGNISGGSNIEITGSAKFNGAVTTSAGTSAITANVTFGQRYGIIAYADNSPYNPVIQTAAVYGVGNGNAPGILGTSYGAGGVGVQAFGDLYGVEGNSNGVGGVGIRGYGYASNGTGVGGVAYGTGPGVYGNSLGGGPAVWCDGIFKWSTYSIAVPTGSSSDVLRGNGTWGAVSFATNATNATNATYADYLGGYIASSWARIFATNSGVANAGGSGVNLLGSTSTGIAGAYVGTSGTSNIVTFTVQTTSPSDVRLKEEIADADLGLAFVKQLRPVSYKLIADPKHQKGYGFIADEVEQIIGLDSSLVYHEPDWKVGDETGFKTIHYPSYIAVLTKAIQELSAQVEELKKQIPKP